MLDGGNEGMMQAQITALAGGRGTSVPWRALAWACALLAAGAGGFWLGARNQEGVGLAVQQQVPFEFYLAQQSFSEIENTKAQLEALSTQFLTELRCRHDASAAGGSIQRSGNPAYVVAPLRAIEEIEKGIEEFKGTEPELLLLRELLQLLKKQGLGQRYLDIYLHAVYQHPTHPLAAWAAKDAIRFSAALGRQHEVAEALEWLTRIPLSYPGKELISLRAAEMSLTRVGSPAGGALAWSRPAASTRDLP